MNAIKLGALIGGTFVIGDIAGAKIADAFGLTLESPWARKGVKIGVGVAAYFLLASVLG